MTTIKPQNAGPAASTGAYAEIVSNPDGTPIMDASGLYRAEDIGTFITASGLDLNLTYFPSGELYFYPREDCWVSFSGAAIADIPSMPLVKGILQGPFQIGRKGMSLVGDTVSGQVGVYYATREVVS